MNQQINLYQPLFRHQPKLLSAVTLSSIVGASLLFMLAVYGHARLSLGALERTSSDMTRTFHRLGEQLVADSASATSPSEESVDAMIAELETRIDDSRDLLAELESLFADSSTGFVDAFEILAETHLGGLWLTAIELDDTGRVRISGKTLDPELVPRYQRLLSRHVSLERLQRARVSLVRADPDVPIVDFVLRYVPPARS